MKLICVTVTNLGALGFTHAETLYTWMEPVQRKAYIAAAIKSTEINKARWLALVKASAGEYMLFIRAKHQIALFDAFWKEAKIDLNKDVVYTVGPIKNHQYMSEPKKLTMYIVKVPESGVFGE